MKMEEIKEMQENGEMKCNAAPGFLGFCIHSHISSVSPF